MLALILRSSFTESQTFHGTPSTRNFSVILGPFMVLVRVRGLEFRRGLSALGFEELEHGDGAAAVEADLEYFHLNSARKPSPFRGWGDLPSPLK